MAGRVGLEPTTSRLTADCSTIELPTHMAVYKRIELLSVGRQPTILTVELINHAHISTKFCKDG